VEKINASKKMAKQVSSNSEESEEEENFKLTQGLLAS